MTDKRVAIITGAASGLGLDMAKQLCHDYQLFLIDLDLSRLEQQSASLPDCQCFGCDLADSDAIEQLVDNIIRQAPDIALLINNAGITHRSLVKVTRYQVIEKVTQ